jgi:hypothetical protein
MRYVVDMGYIYRLNERNYRRMLQQIAEGETVNLLTLGKLVGGIDRNITDMDADDAQMELDWLASERKED